MKFIHCADLHLGSEMSSLDDVIKRETRKAELLSSFKAICKLCKRENADFLVISGDLFDGADIPAATLDTVAESLSELDAQVIICGGNHDYVGVGMPLTRLRDIENVHIFPGSDVTSFDFPETDVCFYGASFTSSHCESGMLGGFRAEQNERFKIGVFHGELADKSDYNPISRAQLLESGLDYIALGHIHKRTDPPEVINRKQYAYSGCHDGRGFDETEEKGCYIIEVNSGNNGTTAIGFAPTSTRRYHEVYVDVSGAQRQSDIVAEAEAAVMRFPYYNEDLFKLVICGRVKQGLKVDLPQIVAQLSKQTFFVKAVSEATTAYDYDKLSQETSLKGVFVKQMLERINSAVGAEERRTAIMALEYGIAAFDGDFHVVD